MKKILFIILSLSLLTECGIYRKTDARKIPGNVNDRVQKNLEEGKRIKLANIANKSVTETNPPSATVPPKFEVINTANPKNKTMEV